jgi:hypothetical protein
MVISKEQVKACFSGILARCGSKNANIHGDEAELASICQGDSKATSINIEGKEIKGKCALGFVAPKPRM